MATGKLIIEYDPATSTNVWAQLTQLNINFFSNNVGAQVESNRVRIAVFETGKVDCAAFSGTNLIFEGRIAVNEAFNVAQALTNTAIDVRLSAEEAATTNQAATNLGFQAVNDAQANTNALKADKTSVNATNLAFGVRIASNETYRITTQPASNVLLQAAIDGKADSGTNRFDELFVANLSCLGSNISGLTQGTYTGSVTTVAYTGVTAVVRGNSYYWGFTKDGPYGTATLSIAGRSLSLTNTGSTTNYFAGKTVDTNLIITIAGDGTSKSDVSDIFVQQVTNGDMAVAGVLRVGENIVINGEEPVLFDAPADDNTYGRKSNAWINVSALTESLWVAASNKVAYTNNATYTATVEKAAVAYPASNPSNFVTAGSAEPLWIAVSNAVVYTNTATYTATVANASSWTNNSLSWSNAVDLTNNVKWDKASSDAIAATTDVGVIQSSTSLWNTGATDASAATGDIAVIHSSTTLWNQASADGISATADVAVLRGATNVLNTRVGDNETDLGYLENATNALDTRVTTLEGQTNSYLTNETYVGTVTGATITASDEDSVVVTGANAAFKWNTNAVAGGAGDFLADGSVPMTGSLQMGAQMITNVSHIDFDGDEVSVGRKAESGIYGTAVGWDADASTSGAVVGWATIGYESGVAIGRSANGANSGVAIGRSANGANSGVAIGRYAEGANYGVAVGYNSSAVSNSVAIGQSVTNTEPNSTKIKGSLNMDGQAVTNVSALQITGTSPTNGAVWIATNTAGQGEWTVFPGIYAENAGTWVSGADWVNATFPTVVNQIEGTWDGTNWTPGVLGYIAIKARGSVPVALTRSKTQLLKNALVVAASLDISTGSGGEWSGMFVSYNDATTNKYKIQVLLGGVYTNLASQPMSFTGKVLP